ncbi:MAG: DUF4384 domain-containing protein [Polyangia bacterium]
MRSLRACICLSLALVSAPLPLSLLWPLPTAAAEAAPLHVRVQLDRLSAGGGQRRPVLPGETLRSGELFALRVTVSQDAYVYVLQASPGGGRLQLFPAAGDTLPDRLLKANVETSLPAQGGVALDEEVGEENIVVIAAPVPLPQADPELSRRLQAAQLRPEQRLAGLTPLASDGETPPEVPRPPPEAPRPPPPPLRPDERDPHLVRATSPAVRTARAGRSGIVAARFPFWHAPAAAGRALPEKVR